MVLDFPNLDALLLALSSGIVPKDLAVQGADVHFADDGRVWVDVEGVPRKTAAALKKLGVKGRKALPDEATRAVACWPEILPLRRRVDLPPLDKGGIGGVDDKTAVLFELPDDGLLPEVVNEVLRLGNDRQSFRVFRNGDESRVLLRIVGPPYYSLLRALEGHGSAESPRAFVEQNDRVWVQVGYSHPLAEKFQPPPGRLLLIAAPHEWTFLEEGRFRDIYDTAEFELPATSLELNEVESQSTLQVPLKLVRGGSGDVAELWVLHENGPAQLDEFVQTADDRLLARLSFAVANPPIPPLGKGGNGGVGRETVVLRLRPGKARPPVLVLDALACGAWLKLPNLFVPSGFRLHPPLRRDVIKRLLADDDKTITWLTPTGDDGGFVPHTLPDGAFRPLSDWVQYVLDRESESLNAWVQSAAFDFEPFICPDDQPDKPKSPRKQRDKSADKPADKKSTQAEQSERKKGLAGRLFHKSNKKGKSDKPAAVTLRRREPSELEKQLRAVQSAFVQSEEPLDAPDREQQWRDMAELNAALKRHNDATACWTHAFWEQETPDADDLWQWCLVEARSWKRPAAPDGCAAADSTGPAALREDVSAVEHHFDDLLSAPNPAPSAVNAAAAFLIWHAFTGNDSVEFNAQLGGLQQLFEKHEAFLPVRTAWLTWTALSKLAGDDVLMLARARDRILERLLQRGLVPNQDLPAFLHNSGAHAGERMRVVRDQLVDLHETARQWSERTLGTASPATKNYVDLIFAWGMARFGETAHAERLLNDLRPRMRSDDVHSWLFRAYEHRIKQALNSEPAAGQLPEALLEELDVMNRMERYKADRLRQHSKILEPHERIEPYRRWRQQHSDELERRLGALTDLLNRGELATQLDALLAQNHRPQDEARVVATALELAPRLGEAVAKETLERVPPLLGKVGDNIVKATLLERGLFLAAHFDQQSFVALFLAELKKLLHLRMHASLKSIESMEAVLAQSFRGLRRMGMRDDISQLLQQLDALVREFEHRMTTRHGDSGADEEPLLVLMQVAAGWLYFGREENAWPILDRVRDTLFTEKDVKPARKVPLACGYLATLGQAPVETAMPRILEVFKKLDGISGGYTTNSHYGLPQLDVVEATMLAMVSDDFTIDKTGRRWMDDDEYLIRRRIHRDTRAMMG